MADSRHSCATADRFLRVAEFFHGLLGQGGTGRREGTAAPWRCLTLPRSTNRPRCRRPPPALKRHSQGSTKPPSSPEGPDHDQHRGRSSSTCDSREAVEQVTGLRDARGTARFDTEPDGSGFKIVHLESVVAQELTASWLVKSAGVTGGTVGIDTLFAAARTSCFTGMSFRFTSAAQFRGGSGWRFSAVSSMMAGVNAFNLRFFFFKIVPCPLHWGIFPTTTPFIFTSTTTPESRNGWTSREEIVQSLNNFGRGIIRTRSETTAYTVTRAGLRQQMERSRRFAAVSMATRASLTSGRR